MIMNKAQQNRLIAFRSTHGDELYLTRAGTWNIITALFLIEEDDRDPEPVSVEELAVTCGFDHRPLEDAETIERDGMLTFPCPDGSRLVIDLGHVLKKLDLTLPLIRDDQGQMIDGHHRLYQAFMLGVETLKGHRLTQEEAKLCFFANERERHYAE